MERNLIQNNYFTSYEDLEIHKLMLEDDPRTSTYRQAILDNKDYFKDKVVMDVGCGTGILSIFCAQAGAKKVYAVEASTLANLAKEIVKENNVENVVEVIHSKVEDVVLPDNIKVDAIVSEWMGFYLLHEGMLDSVIAARDKFLKEGGEMFPEVAVVYVAPCSVPSLNEKWENFHGVSMSAFSKHLRADKSQKPEVMQLRNEDLLGEAAPIIWLNMADCSVKDLDSFTAEYVVGANKNGRYQGICIWFECIFPNVKDEISTVLRTGPACEPTHWKQTVILLPEEQIVEEKEAISFKLDVDRDRVNSRRYNLQLTLLDPQDIEHPVPCSCDMTKCILTLAVMKQTIETIKNPISNSVLEEEPIDE